MDRISKDLQQPFTALVLSIADDKFFLGHRNGDWTGLAPFLEEDIAFSNIAQDEIAHAQELYKLVASVTHPDGDILVEANRLAYSRPAGERLNARLVEPADDFDWATAIARQFVYDHFDRVRLPRLKRSSYRPLADLAGKMLQEIMFHIDHFDNWMKKLGQGTDESRQKLQQAVDRLWRDSGGLFEAVADQNKLVESDLYPGSDAEMQAEWESSVKKVITDAGVRVPADPLTTATGGRRGQHTADLQELLDELAEVYQCEPGASW